METYYKLQEPSYKARQEHEKKDRLNLVKQEVLICYQTMMDTYCGGPDIVPQFDAVHDRAQLKALEVFNTAVNKYNLLEPSELFSEISEV
jgi:hypothetical protein